MSVPVGKRNKNKFEAIVKAQAVVKHILLITKNEKIDECFGALLNHISKGNTYYYRQKFKKFYEELWRDYEKS